MNSIANPSILVAGSICLCLIIAYLIKTLNQYWLTPLRIQRSLNSQGINGPAYKFIHGNNKETVKLRQEALRNPMPGLSHDIFPRVMPQIHSRIKLYGKNYLYWVGCRAQLVITEPELVKEVMKRSDRVIRKRTSREEKKKENEFVMKLLGDGLVTSEGEKWARQRKLANHAFHGESLKTMSPAMIDSVETMLERWKQFEGEIEVFEQFRLLTSEMISRTAFGSSYLEGQKIFEMLTELSVITNRNLFKARFPIISKVWKTKDEIESDKLEKGIHDCVMEIAKNREEKVANGEANSFGTDFLGLLLNAYHDTDTKNKFSEQDLVDECKTFYFAGQETTNSSLPWTILLLAIHQDWQEKARREVIEIFGNRNPNHEGIGKLKIMTMIINETLRLYPPVCNMVRKVETEVQLGNLILPADLELLVSNLALHHDPQLWGDDVNVFKPERFKEGVANATKRNSAAFIPFGMGPRSCVGMSFALTEMKTALAMILRRYTFSLSPTYSHAPLTLLMLKPQHGIQGCNLYLKEKRDWLSTLLQTEFFRTCSDHRQSRKNEKNVFCIDCNLEFCRHCKVHSQHVSLQICKYVYQDVVRLQEVQKHIDCSKIQTYKINGEKAVHLNPRPPVKDAKPLTKSKTGAACVACGRYLQDSPNRFCSISCKVLAVDHHVKPKNQTDKPELSVRESTDLSRKDHKISLEEKQSSLSSTDVSEEAKTLVTTSLKPMKRVQKRKGIPHRAPTS